MLMNLAGLKCEKGCAVYAQQKLKTQTRLLVREGAPHQQTGDCLKIIKGRRGQIGNRLCGLVVRVLGYRSGGPGSIPGSTRKKKVVGPERGPFSLVSSTEELLYGKVAAPV
jgi:hypothetical protein